MTSAAMQFVQQFEKSPEPKERRKRAKPMTQVELAMTDARYRSHSGDWEGAKGSTFVGLYAMCHFMVYGVIPSELDTAGIFHAAARNAAKAMHELFHDDPTEVAEFVRWSWEREKRKNNWALQKCIDRARMSWKWQFSRGMETDYRVYLAEKKKPRRF